MLNFSGLVYTLGSIILFCVTLRLWNSYQKSKNLVTKNFAYTGFSLTISLFIYGMVSLFFSYRFDFLKIGGQIASIPLIFASAFGLRVFFYSKLKKIPPNFAFFIAVIFGFISSFLYMSYPGHPHVIKGIIEVIDWDVNPKSSSLLSILVLIFIIPLTISFIQEGIKNLKVRVRSFLLAAGFLLTAIGAILNSSSLGWFVIFLGGIFVLFGFTSVAFAFFFTKPFVE